MKNLSTLITNKIIINIPNGLDSMEKLINKNSIGVEYPVITKIENELWNSIYDQVIKISEDNFNVEFKKEIMVKKYFKR